MEREDTRRACSISAKEERSALSWYRYLSGDNDRMAIAGVAVARFDPSFEARIPTCNRMQQRSNEGRC